MFQRESPRPRHPGVIVDLRRAKTATAVLHGVIAALRRGGIEEEEVDRFVHEARETAGREGPEGLWRVVRAWVYLVTDNE